MNDDLYWALLEEAWESIDKDAYDALKMSLSELNLIELAAFSKSYTQHQDKLYQPSHLCAAYLINEGIVSDEIFAKYTEGVAGAPKALYVDVLHNPDGLLDHDIYKNVLQLDTYPFSSLPVILGKERFGREWNLLCSRDEWKILPTDIESIEIGERGRGIVTPELCKHLVPRLYSTFYTQCDWSRIR